jgi:phosphatidylethanolamine/phosphatidyl-N-methylethanolamine N-methyltransferase
VRQLEHSRYPEKYSRNHVLTLLLRLELMAEPHQSRVYSDLAYLYDSIFGRAFVDHEQQVIESLSFRPGQQVLEVGVGTGISLGAYPPYVRIIGIDPSDDMLAHAIAKIQSNGAGHIELRKGDAQQLDFPDDSFEWVTSFHVMTVVPQPRRMMDEIVRVCKPGGRIVLVSHFASRNPFLYFMGTVINPVTKLLGWTTRLRAADVLDGQPITVERHQPLSRLSVHYAIVARKDN